MADTCNAIPVKQRLNFGSSDSARHIAYCSIMFECGIIGLDILLIADSQVRRTIINKTKQEKSLNHYNTTLLLQQTRHIIIIFNIIDLYIFLFYMCVCVHGTSSTYTYYTINDNIQTK